MIKNKEKRSEVHAKLKHKKKLEKRAKAKARDAAMKRALELSEELPKKRVPRTIENTQELDETICKPDDEEPDSAYALHLVLRLPVSFHHRFFGHFFSSEQDLEEAGGEKSRALEKMQNKVAKAHRKAEERRASVEAKRGTKVARVLEIASLMKA